MIFEITVFSLFWVSGMFITATVLGTIVNQERKLDTDLVMMILILWIPILVFLPVYYAFLFSYSILEKFSDITINFPVYLRRVLKPFFNFGKWIRSKVIKEKEKVID